MSPGFVYGQDGTNELSLTHMSELLFFNCLHIIHPKIKKCKKNNEKSQQLTPLRPSIYIREYKNMKKVGFYEVIQTLT